MAHKTDTTLTGAAGEHLVLSRLLQRGIVAAQAPEGVRKVDVLVNFLDGGTPCFIQVKARQFGSDGGWHMSLKHETITDDDVFYAFVDFQPEHPEVYLLPSKVVAEAISTAHKIWLETPGKNGKTHNPTDMRRLGPKIPGKNPEWLDEYLERWDLLQS